MYPQKQTPAFGRGFGGQYMKVGSKTSKNKSLSPVSRMRQQGEDFMQRIDRLRDDLQLEGKSLQGIQKEISMERKHILQSERQTPSQKKVAEKMKDHIEKKKI